MKNKIDKIIKAIGYIEDFKATETLENDLGFDSLDVVECIVEIEKEFSIHIDETEIEGIKTIQDIYDFVDKKMK